LTGLRHRGTGRADGRLRTEDADAPGAADADCRCNQNGGQSPSMQAWREARSTQIAFHRNQAAA